METKNLFISCGANTVENGIIWLDNLSSTSGSRGDTYLAYASSNMISLVNFHEKKLVCTLLGHTGNVTTITSSKNNSENYIEIISSGEDGTVIIWRHNLGDPIHNWSIIEKLSNLQDGSITCHSTLWTDLGMLISASNSKARLCLWYRACNTNSFILHEEIPIPPAQIPKSINLMNCPCRGSQRTPSVLLAIGSVDSRVHLRLLNIINTNEIMTFSKSTIVGLLSGHEDWVTCLSEPYYLPHKTAADTSDLYFASGSQDSKIRIWKITPSMLTLDKESKFSNSQTELKYEEPNEIDDDDEPEEEEEEGDTETQKNTVGVVSEENTGEARCAFMASQFTCDAGSLNEFLLFSVTLETLLVGHEDWVTSLHWMSCSTTVTSSELSLRLFSTSMDRNMVVWSPDPSDGIWSPTIRIGDIGGNLGGSVGGNLLGFVGGCTMVTKNENDLLVESILGIGFGGSFHLWQRVMNGDPQGDIWKPRSFLTGHFGAVTDVTWSNCPDDVSSITNNEFIITVSQDQTCRLFAPVKIAETSDMNSWAEVSRPQIHGYNLSCISLVPFNRSPFTYFSGGDEKAIRSFESPTVVLEGLSILAHNTSARQLLESSDSMKRVQSAYIPELGLSNRASNLMTGDEIKEQASRGIDAIHWEVPPLEGQLADKTIWPEINKLHGHAGDVVCLSISHCGSWLASAAKGRDTKTSAILIWELKRMVCIANLLGHESTVTALAFSSNSRYLASGGKDRSLLIHECIKPDEVNAIHQHTFTPRVFLKNAHKRIIWDMTWVGNTEDLLATASRDGTAKIWKINSTNNSSIELTLLSTLNPFDGNAVTSIDSTVLCYDVGGIVGWLLLLGAENGNMQIWLIPSDLHDATSAAAGGLSPIHIHTIPSYDRHGASVLKMKWKESKKLKFVSCSEDHSVRIFQCQQIAVES